jgi:hypothetical protein
VRALRGLLRFGIPAGAAGVLLWAVSPALSLTPYMPEAVDFEQRIPGVERLATPADRVRGATADADEGPVRFVSPVIDAPARFDLVGVAGELRPLEYRARLDGEQWTQWIETANGDPVYFGGGDQVQVRSRGVRPTGRLHYVNVSGTDTFVNRVLTDARGAVNSAFVSIASVASVATTGAIPPQPDMVSRGEWGAKRASGGCRPRTGPAYGEVRAATVHHTVTANDYDRDEAPGIVLGICRFHRNGNGWNDIGYNFLVDRFGDIYVGRSGGIKKAVVGAHAQGYNSQTTGVASIGTHSSDPISVAAEDAFVSVIAWKLALHGAKAAGRTRLLSGGGAVNRFPAGRKVKVKRVFGHRRVNSTECPGDELNAVLKRIRARAQERVTENGGLAPPQRGD